MTRAELARALYPEAYERLLAEGLLTEAGYLNERGLSDVVRRAREIRAGLESCARWQARL